MLAERILDRLIEANNRDRGREPQQAEWQRYVDAKPGGLEDKNVRQAAGQVRRKGRH